MPLTVTARELSKRSRVPLRQVQTWTTAGVLLPDEGSENPGRGASRQYPASELDVAILLGAVSHHGMSVSEAKALSQPLRNIVRSADAIVSTPGGLLIFETKTHEHLRDRTAKLAKQLKMAQHGQDQLLAYAGIQRAKAGHDAFLILTRQASGDWTIRTLLAPEDGPGAQALFSDKAMGGYLIHLAKLFR